MVDESETEGKNTTAAEELKAHTRLLQVLVPGADDRPWNQKLAETCHAVLTPVLASIGFGAILILAAVLYLHHEAREILVHLGGAFVVAGVVSFGLEWGREVLHVRALTAMLVNMLWEYKEKIFSAPLKQSVQNGMLALMHDSEQQVAAQVPQLGAYVGQLVSRGSWTSVAYRTFLREFHTQMTERAAHLATISGSLAADSFEVAADERVDMPDTVKLADVLVENIVTELLREQNRQNAECLNVSDLYTWTTLSRLKNIQHKTAEQITLKRLFVLGLSSDQHITAEGAHEVLSQHLSWTENTNYEIRLMLIEDYQEISLFELKEAKHFGIFKPNPSVGRPVAVLVRDEGISKMRLVAASEAMLAEFETLWSRAKPVSKYAKTTRMQEDIPAETERPSHPVLDDFLLAYYIRRMPNDGNYKGISNLSDWINGHYDVFTRAARKSFSRKGVLAKRIFVRDVDLDEDHVVEFLRQQEQHRRDTDKRYEWRLCEPCDPRGEIAKAIPVGYYESASADDPSKVVIERAQPTRQFSQTTSDENHLLDASFTRLWNRCRHPKEVVAEIVPDRVEEVFGIDATRRRRQRRLMALRLRSKPPTT